MLSWVNGAASLQHLPTDIRLILFAHLSVDDVPLLARVCKEWKQLIDSVINQTHIRARKAAEEDFDRLSLVASFLKLRFIVSLTESPASPIWGRFVIPAANPEFPEAPWLHSSKADETRREFYVDLRAAVASGAYKHVNTVVCTIFIIIILVLLVFFPQEKLPDSGKSI